MSASPVSTPSAPLAPSAAQSVSLINLTPAATEQRSVSSIAPASSPDVSRPTQSAQALPAQALPAQDLPTLTYTEKFTNSLATIVRWVNWFLRCCGLCSPINEEEMNFLEGNVISLPTVEHMREAEGRRMSMLNQLESQPLSIPPHFYPRIRFERLIRKIHSNTIAMMQVINARSHSRADEGVVNQTRRMLAELNHYSGSLTHNKSEQLRSANEMFLFHEQDLGDLANGRALRERPTWWARSLEMASRAHRDSQSAVALMAVR